jgi:hypothetical protein
MIGADGGDFRALVEWYWQEGNKVLSQFHIFHHKSHRYWPGYLQPVDQPSKRPKKKRNSSSLGPSGIPAQDLTLLDSAVGTRILLTLADFPVLAENLDFVTERISATKGITCCWSGEELILYGWRGFESRVVRSLWLETCATLAHSH